MMRSLTARSDTARTIPHPAPIWDMTAIGIPAHEQARGAADNRPRPRVLSACQVPLSRTVPERGMPCRSLIGTQLFFRR